MSNDQGIALPTVLEKWDEHALPLPYFPVGEQGTSSPTTAEVLLVHEKRKAVDLFPLAVARQDWMDARSPHARERKGTAMLLTEESFIKHVLRNKRPETAIFVTPTRITAIYDYHGDAATGQPGHCRHVAVHAWPHSEAWLFWTQLCKSGPLSQARLAEVIEERVDDILNPAAPEVIESGALDIARQLDIELGGPTTMLALARGIDVNIKKRIGAAHRTDNGAVSLVFEEEHSATVKGASALTVPAGFLVGIAVFEGGARFTITVRIGYTENREEKTVSWRVRMQGANDAIKEAREEALVRIAEETGVPVFHGTPESGA